MSDVKIGNVDLLKRVVRKLKTLRTQRKNDQFDMYCWLIQDEECGTVACIAGWAVNLADKPFVKHWLDAENFIYGEPDFKRFEEHARQLLGIETETESGRVFLTTSWPKEYQDMAEKEGVMNAAIAYLEYLIEVNENRLELS